MDLKKVPVLKQLAISATLVAVSVAAYAGIFGPSNPSECFQKYSTKTYYNLGVKVISAACTARYLNDDPMSKSARCILDDADKLSNYNDSLSLINKCTTKYEARGAYGVYYKILHPSSDLN